MLSYKDRYVVKAALRAGQERIEPRGNSDGGRKRMGKPSCVDLQGRS